MFHHSIFQCTMTFSVFFCFYLLAVHTMKLYAAEFLAWNRLLKASQYLLLFLNIFWLSEKSADVKHYSKSRLAQFSRRVQALSAVLNVLAYFSTSVSSHKEQLMRSFSRRGESSKMWKLNATIILQDIIVGIYTIIYNEAWKLLIFFNWN